MHISSNYIKVSSEPMCTLLDMFNFTLACSSTIKRGLYLIAVEAFEFHGGAGKELPAALNFYEV